MSSPFRYQQECASDLVKDDRLRGLLDAHFEEMGDFKDIPLDPNFDVYIKMDEGGSLRCYTARYGWKLVGYAIYIVTLHPHHKTSMQAFRDVLFVDPAFRGRTIGKALLSFAAEQLRDEGVQMEYQHVKRGSDAERLLQSMDYEMMHVVYGRRLD